MEALALLREKFLKKWTLLQRSTINILQKSQPDTKKSKNQA
jgi:hypothetical protein